MLNLRPWLLAGAGGDRPEYQEYLKGSGGEGLFTETGLALTCVAAVVALRMAFNRWARPRAQALVQQHAAHDHHRDASKLVEEAWVLLGNTAMLCWSAWVMLTQNSGCWFFGTETCLRGWPLHPTPPAVRLYYNVEGAWYIHLLLKPLLRYGAVDGRDMMLHHCMTLALVALSWGLGLTRIGVLVLCVFNISNPFLHAAKIANQLSSPARTAAFALFALVFFATRVLLVPRAILRVTVLDSREQVPHVVSDFWWFYAIINALLAALYMLQLSWMWSIVRVLRQAIVAGADAASHLSTHVDPSKRYKLAAGVGQASNGEGSKTQLAGGENGTVAAKAAQEASLGRKQD